SGFAEQAIQQIESRPDPPSARAQGLGPGVDRVLLEGLAKEPGERHPSAAGFVSALAGALERPVAGERPLLHPERRRSHARPAAVAAVVIALVAVAGVIVLGTGADGGSPDRARHASAGKAAKQGKATPKTNAAPPATAGTAPVAPA